MHFATTLLLLSLPFALTAPARGGIEVAALTAQTCAITGSNVKHRKCPHVDDKKCPASGEYQKGNKVKFLCWTTGDSVGGNTYVPFAQFVIHSSGIKETNYTLKQAIMGLTLT
jgi:hypothetical protein